MNILTIEDFEKHECIDFLPHAEIDLIKNEWRRGNTFYRQEIAEITKEDCENFDFPLEWEGLWQSQSFLWSDDLNNDYENCYPYTRVLKVEKEITTVVTTYEEVK